MLDKIKRFVQTDVGSFIIGSLIGLSFFVLFYGPAIVNPLETNWIWQPATHDTAQHFLGWQFFRANSDGGIIKGLAYPHGLSIVFMDAIPLLALVTKPFSHLLPQNFQYFGIWALLCYVLMGGLAAVLVNRIWRRVVTNHSSSASHFLFILAGSILFVLSPMVMARTLYHPALAAQWLILLGFILIWDSPALTRLPRFLIVWSLTLTMAILIHPYFLPMMVVLMLIAAIRGWRYSSDHGWKRWLLFFVRIIIPVGVALSAFALVGGFSLGSGAEVYDLADKGFNLLSFANPAGYSIIPALPNRSTSPETMMWLGLGVWSALLVALILWHGHYREALYKLKLLYRDHKAECWALTLTCLGLLIFAMGVRIDVGPVTLIQYSVPDKIYQIWSAFRAAAREAWPFYYAFILAIIYALALILRKRQMSPLIIAGCLIAFTALQAMDVIYSPKALSKRADYADIAARPPQYRALALENLFQSNSNLKRASHLTALDDEFRGDQSGTYIIGQTALKYGYTLNTGFFARVPDAIKSDQARWRRKLINGDELSTLSEYLFFTGDQQLADQLRKHYQLTKIGSWWFVTNDK